MSDSAKDDNITKDSEVIDHPVCDHDHPNGKLWDTFPVILFSAEEYYIFKKFEF